MNDLEDLDNSDTEEVGNQPYPEGLDTNNFPTMNSFTPYFWPTRSANNRNVPATDQQEDWTGLMHLAEELFGSPDELESLNVSSLSIFAQAEPMDYESIEVSSDEMDYSPS